MIRVGEKLPDFCLNDQNGKEHCRDDFKDKRLVMFFYIKDNTPGWKKEAVAFQRQLKALEGLNTKVIGVSSDSVESHQKFADEYDLTYPLLADVDKKLAKKFEVVNMIGIYKRTTFIISKEQKIMKVFPKVKIDGHVERIVEYLKDID